MADQIRMPSGMGGLVRYFDDYKSKIEIRPEIILILIALVVVIEYLLHHL
ncbi:MAG: preprotein translocase subunit Sec61beta [archaeon]